jgi:hypothetical protein
MSIFKGYPYGEPKSLEIFPTESRPSGQQIEGGVKDDLQIPAAVVALYSKALHEAEQQVRDLQTDYPFIPEDYGFAEVDVVGPNTIYKSHDDNVMMTRMGDDWIIASGKLSRAITMSISSEKEAYTAFKLLGLLESIKTEKDVDNSLNFTGERVNIILNNADRPIEFPPSTSEDTDLADISPDAQEFSGTMGEEAQEHETDERGN